MHNENDNPMAKGSSDMNWRVIVGIVVAALAAIFILQNTSKVQIKFLIWDFETGMWFGLLISLVLGMAIGWGLSMYAGRRKKQAAKSKKK